MRLTASLFLVQAAMMSTHQPSQYCARPMSVSFVPETRRDVARALEHLDGVLNYCRTKVRFGVVEAVNGNIRMLINRGRGYRNLRYLLLKAKRMAVTNIEFIAVHTVKKAA